MSLRTTASLIAAWVACLGIAAPVAAAHTYRTGIDLGNDPAAGCDFILGAVAPGTLPGFELQITVVVDNTVFPPTVSAMVETCDGAIFVDPQPLLDFVLQIDSGLLASDSVVGSVPAALLGTSPEVRLAHHALSTDGSEDALFTTDGTADGDPIVVPVFQPPLVIPVLTGLGAVFLALALLVTAGWLLSRRRPVAASTVATLIALCGAVALYAAFGDPVALDDPSDASPPDTRSEIIAAFTMSTPDDFQVRLDIANIPLETNCADHTDNDFDLLVDCEDPDCLSQPCDDLDACTANETCISFPVRGTASAAGLAVCLGDPICRR